MKLTSVLLASIVALASPAAVLAEESHHKTTAPEATAPAAPAQAIGMMAMMPAMMGMMQKMTMMQEMMDPTRHVEGRIAFLHAELAITEAQEPAWKALADALRQNASGMMQVTAADHSHDAGSVVMGQMLDQQLAMEARLDGLKAINAALKPLVDSLSDDQRATLDELFPHVSGMMEMGGMMPMSGMMPGAPSGAMSGMAGPAP